MSVLELRASSDEAPERDEPLGKSRLKALLVLIDTVSLAIGFIVMVLIVGTPYHRPWWSAPAMVLSATVIGLACLRGQGLFLARVSVVRVVELTRSTRAFAVLALCMVVLDRLARFGFRTRYLVVATIISWTFFVVGRSAYRAWVTAKRTSGHHLRSVILVGADAEVARLVELFATHRELGLMVLGVVGNREEARRNGLDTMWLGDSAHAEAIVEFYGASGVVISPASLAASRLTRLIRDLQGRDVHVHLATGVAGIDAGRLRSLPMSYEPMLYVEAATLSRTQRALKRGFDILFSSLLLVITAPVWAVVAMAIKLTDPGPVFFRQERIGRNGATFSVLKFRTMRVDAERLLAALRADNERIGPLFKMESDPRVTRIGKVLRDSSLDELPQLWNVLKGEMSLVGPRPALPSEVADFCAELRQREQVMPGITGLWQVEARDNPSFEAYRRLDLFYVDNWSLTLDLIIILGTVEQLAAKIVTMITRRLRSRSSADWDRAPLTVLAPEDQPASPPSAPQSAAS